MKNFRDFGCEDVIKGVLFRGEALHHLSAKEKKLILDQSNIKVVVDLRTQQERDSKPDDELPGVTNYHLPLITMEEMGSSSEKEAKRTIIKTHQLPDIYHYYRRLIAIERKESWTQIFNLLLQREEGGIYFHCTAGKDRTGIAAAIILTVLGVSNEAILEDYLETNKHIVFPLAYRAFMLTLDKKTQKEFKEYLRAHQDYLEASFEQIEDTYGSFRGFLEQCCGLDEEKISHLKEKYVIRS